MTSPLSSTHSHVIKWKNGEFQVDFDLEAEELTHFELNDTKKLFHYRRALKNVNGKLVLKSVEEFLLINELTARLAQLNIERNKYSSTLIQQLEEIFEDFEVHPNVVNSEENQEYANNLSYESLCQFSIDYSSGAEEMLDMFGIQVELDKNMGAATEHSRNSRLFKFRESVIKFLLSTSRFLGSEREKTFLSSLKKRPNPEGFLEAMIMMYSSCTRYEIIKRFVVNKLTTTERSGFTKNITKSQFIRKLKDIALGGIFLEFTNTVIPFSNTEKSQLEWEEAEGAVNKVNIALENITTYLDATKVFDEKLEAASMVVMYRFAHISMVMRQIRTLIDMIPEMKHSDLSTIVAEKDVLSFCFEEQERNWGSDFMRSILTYRDELRMKAVTYDADRKRANSKPGYDQTDDSVEPINSDYITGVVPSHLEETPDRDTEDSEHKVNRIPTKSQEFCNAQTNDVLESTDHDYPKVVIPSHLEESPDIENIRSLVKKVNFILSKTKEYCTLKATEFPLLDNYKNEKFAIEALKLLEAGLFRAPILNDQTKDVVKSTGRKNTKVVIPSTLEKSPDIEHITSLVKKVNRLLTDPQERLVLRLKEFSMLEIYKNERFSNEALKLIETGSLRAPTRTDQPKEVIKSAGHEYPKVVIPSTLKKSPDIEHITSLVRKVNNVLQRSSMQFQYTLGFNEFPLIEKYKGEKFATEASKLLEKKTFRIPKKISKPNPGTYGITNANCPAENGDIVTGFKEIAITDQVPSNPDDEVDKEQGQFFCPSTKSRYDIDPDKVTIPSCPRDIRRPNFPHSALWIQAEQELLSSFNTNGVLIGLNQDESNSEITVAETRWFYCITKNEGKVTSFNASIIVHGVYAQFELGQEECPFSQVFSAQVLRTMLSLAVQKRMHVHRLNILSEFLESKVSENIYVNFRGSIEKMVHGLKQGTYQHYEYLKDSLISLQFNVIDNACNTFYSGVGADRVFIVVFVNEILVLSENLHALKYAKERILKSFKGTDAGEAKNFSDMNINYDWENGILKLDSSDSIDKILEEIGCEKIYITDCPMIENWSDSSKIYSQNWPLPFEMKRRYKNVLEMLDRLCNSCRLDICYSTGRLKQFLAAPTFHHYEALNFLVGYIVGSREFGIVYTRNASGGEFTAYTDSVVCTKGDKNVGIAGFVILLGGAPIIWDSQKMDENAEFMGTEVLALAMCASQLKFMDRFLKVHNFYDCGTATIYESIKQLVTVFEKLKGLRPKFIGSNIVFDSILVGVQNKSWKICYIEPNNQMASMFTQPLTKAQFAYFLNMSNYHATKMAAKECLLKNEGTESLEDEIPESLKDSSIELLDDERPDAIISSSDDMTTAELEAASSSSACETEDSE